MSLPRRECTGKNGVPRAPAISRAMSDHSDQFSISMAPERTAAWMIGLGLAAG